MNTGKEGKEKICADLTSDDIKHLCSQIPLKNQYIIKDVILRFEWKMNCHQQIIDSVN